MKRKYVTQRASAVLAMAVARQMGIRVVFTRQDFAGTDGHVIYLPSLPTLVDERVGEMLKGLSVHEGGHVLFTTFKAVPRGALVRSLANAIEDIRMERLCQKKYPGAAKMLHSTIRTCMDKEVGWFQPPDPNDHPASVLNMALLYRLRVGELGQTALTDFSDQYDAVAKQVFGEKLWGKIFDIALDGSRGENTKAVVDAAKAIIKLLKDEQKINKKQSQNQKGQSGKSSETGNGDSGSGGQGSSESQSSQSESNDQNESSNEQEPGQVSDNDKTDGQSESDSKPNSAKEKGKEETKDDSDPSSGNGEGEEEFKDKENGDSSKDHAGSHQNNDSTDADDSSRQDKANSQSGSGASIDGTQDPEKLIDALKQALGAEEGDIRKSDLSDLLKSLAGNGVKVMKDLKLPQQPPTTPTKLEKVIKNRLGGHLEALLVAETECKFRPSEHGRLHTRRIARAMVGNPTIFRHKHQAEGLDTAVYILGDSSSSMTDGGHYVIQRDAIRAIVQVLEANDIQTAIGLFNSMLTQLKDFDEMIDYHRIPALASSTTNMPGGLYHATGELIRRDENRRVLILLSDGLSDLQESAAIVNEANNLGIETAPVFIGNLIAQSYEKSDQIKNFCDSFPIPPRFAKYGDEIPVKLTEALTEALNLSGI